MSVPRHVKEQNYLNECENVAKKYSLSLDLDPVSVSSASPLASNSTKTATLARNKVPVCLYSSRGREEETGNKQEQERQLRRGPVPVCPLHNPRNPQFITIEDHYQDSYRPRQLQDKERVDKIPHARPFRNTDSRKTMYPLLLYP